VVSNATIATSAESRETGARSTISKTMGIRMAAVAMRFHGPEARSVAVAMAAGSVAMMSVNQAAVTPLPLLVLGDCFQKVLAAKVGP